MLVVIPVPHSYRTEETGREDQSKRRIEGRKERTENE
jgi:hypothetical protein